MIQDMYKSLIPSNFWAVQKLVQRFMSHMMVASPLSLGLFS